MEKEKRKFKERIREHYRLVVLNDETLKEVSSYKINLLNFYILTSVAFVITGIIIVCLIVFTPLKTLIPGYGDIEANKEFIELLQKTNELEEDLVAINKYLEHSKNRLVGMEGEGSIELETNDGIESRVPINISPSNNRRLSPPKGNLGKAKLGQYYLLAPINGPISSDFNPQDEHFGVDILGPKNNAIKAIMDGIVISSDWTLETGNTIAIQHSNNIVSFYKHNSALLKKAGSFVEAGEAIAIIGNTGTLSDGPHLHFELWYNGHPVNPTEFINF